MADVSLSLRLSDVTAKRMHKNVLARMLSCRQLLTASGREDGVDVVDLATGRRFFEIDDRVDLRSRISPELEEGHATCVDFAGIELLLNGHRLVISSRLIAKPLNRGVGGKVPESGAKLSLAHTIFEAVVKHRVGIVILF